MRVILDTNIFISREDNKVVPDSVQKLLALLNRHTIQILVHPGGKDDIERDKNSERKKIIQSKISSYLGLDSPPDPTLDSEFQSKCGTPKNENDKIDNKLNDILNQAPQTILELSQSQYEWIKSEGALDERFTFN